jgi:hypothetical protein
MELTDIIKNIIDTTINSFNFTYCLIVNILTYAIIKLIDDIRKVKTKTWVKRVVLLCCILSTGVVYWAFGKDVELLVNSAILATVSWDLIFKPICKKLGIDYNQIDETVTK